MHWPHLSTLQQRGSGQSESMSHPPQESSAHRAPARCRCRRSAHPHLCAAIFSCLEFSGDMRGCRSCRVGEEGPLGMGIPVSPAVNVMLTAARLAPPPVPLAPCGTAERQGQIGVCATCYNLMGACTRGRRRERGGGGFTQASTMPDPATAHPPRARCEAKAAKVALTARSASWSAWWGARAPAWERCAGSASGLLNSRAHNTYCARNIVTGSVRGCKPFRRSSGLGSSRSPGRRAVRGLRPLAAAPAVITENWRTVSAASRLGRALLPCCRPPPGTAASSYCPPTYVAYTAAS